MGRLVLEITRKKKGHRDSWEEQKKKKKERENHENRRREGGGEVAFVVAFAFVARGVEGKARIRRHAQDMRKKKGEPSV